MNNTIEKPRLISEIATEIKIRWETANYAARKYIDAMLKLHHIDDMYYLDRASDIINCFLCNAYGWRGDHARRIKKELNDLVKTACKPQIPDVPFKKSRRRFFNG